MSSARPGRRAWRSRAVSRWPAGTVTLNVAGWLGRARRAGQPPGLAADRLSGLFLVMALGAAVPVSVAFASWAAGPAAAATRMLARATRWRSARRR